jgi:hypothetical protein
MRPHVAGQTVEPCVGTVGSNENAASYVARIKSASLDKLIALSATNAVNMAKFGKRNGGLGRHIPPVDMGDRSPKRVRRTFFGGAVNFIPRHTLLWSPSREHPRGEVLGAILEFSIHAVCSLMSVPLGVQSLNQRLYAGYSFRGLIPSEYGAKLPNLADRSPGDLPREPASLRARRRKTPLQERSAQQEARP